MTTKQKAWIIVAVALLPVALLGARLALVKSYSYALYAHAKGDFAIALPIVYANALLNDFPACGLLGTMYLFGQGVSRNGREAEYWLNKAANGDSVQAQSLLGIMYATGQGVAVDRGKAQMWLTKAAAAGDVEATAMLRRLYQGERI